MDTKSGKYYLPSPSGWPIKGSIALLCLLAGVANWLHSQWYGPYLTAFGFVMMIYVVQGWFGTVIQENRDGKLHPHQVEQSFKLSMLWFIFSEIMFFSSFFAALFIHVFLCCQILAVRPASVTFCYGRISSPHGR